MHPCAHCCRLFWQRPLRPQQPAQHPLSRVPLPFSSACAITSCHGRALCRHHAGRSSGIRCCMCLRPSWCAVPPAAVTRAPAARQQPQHRNLLRRCLHRFGRLCRQPLRQCPLRPQQPPQQPLLQHLCSMYLQLSWCAPPSAATATPSNPTAASAAGPAAASALVRSATAAATAATGSCAAASAGSAFSAV